MRWSDFKFSPNPTIVTWETNTARFLHIELSPSHIFRIRIDKAVKEKKGGGELA